MPTGFIWNWSNRSSKLISLDRNAGSDLASLNWLNTSRNSASLRETNAELGVRDIEAQEKLASSAGLSRVEIAAMPANHLTPLFEPKTA